MIEQFKGKPNIEVLQAALARQLADVYAFFEELNSLLRINSAEGVQLDGIGDIVVMSRAEALAVSKKAGQTVPMDDETYRLYLKWKNALNTTNCTHKDRHSAMKRFWDKSPIYYSEKPEHPATIYLTISEAITDSEAEIFQIASLVKAAGVALIFILDGGKFTVTGYVGATSIDAIDTTIYPRPRNHITALPAATHIGTAALASTMTTIYPIEGD